MRLIRVIATLAVSALIVTACSSSAASPAPATAAPATGGGGGNAVSIQNFAFNPAELTTTGRVVTWTNLDDAAHTVVFDDTSIAPSGNLTKGGQPFSVTFAGAGTFAYKCGIHATMKGTVKVS